MIRMRQAEEQDVRFAADCFDYAREYQKEQGFVQWTNDYPNIDTAIEDVKSKNGFVFYDDTASIGYMFIDFEPEPAYENIDGEWKSEQKYGVIHRLVFSKSARGNGLSKEAFRLIKEYCVENKVYSIRIDTDKNNKVMQYILGREGFDYCGLISFQDGPKLAYQCDFN